MVLVGPAAVRGGEAPKPEKPAAAPEAPAAKPGEIPLQLYQVAIEAVVVEINEKFSRQIGVQYTYARNEFEDDGVTPEQSIVKGVDFNAPNQAEGVIVPMMNIIPGGFNFANVTRTPGAGISLTGMEVGNGQMGVRLRALIENGKAKIRSRPMAVTLNDTVVDVQTVDQVPYQDVVYKGTAGKVQIMQEPVGVKLQCQPSIKSLDERLVELDLKNIEVSAVARFVTINHVQRPVFVRSKANTNVVLHDHDTLVIGGFKIEQESEARQGVPILVRIPIIKWAFSNESKNLERRDIFFYITPHILAPGVQPLLPRKFEHREPIEDLQIQPPEAPW